MTRQVPDLSLYLVVGAGDTGSRPLEEVVLAAVAGGVTLVQLREKNASTRAMLERAKRLKVLLVPRGVPLIVNDRVDVALAAGADGVHLGQDDMPPADARRLVGEHMVLGLSVGDENEAETADPALVDYIGIGPAFATGTKADAGSAIGPDGVAALRRRVALPAVAIGGITAANAVALRDSGVEGIAVVSAICAAEDPKSAARELRAAFSGA
ncbi:thiamine phosphate synthase [Ferruginivarius sediminum]|uniref:Thiamine-phosphate synthase n=1 Tax=Ferruginivarius sediminum TaxID=2661937 RepID=A0A369TEI5_9PROT|nr:thiamine phosphate synthase [Ferruginivarius sediminum]RDD63670.1 thiamine phosphate synthase [Ferruginivarius sediminum]